MRLKFILLTLLLLAISGLAQAQDIPLPSQGSTAYEAAHQFTGSKLSTICVNFHTQALRFLMIWDAAAVPVDGAVTPLWCQPLSIATDAADRGVCFDWTFHPLLFRTGIATAVSVNAAGCTTKTADGANDWFNGQAQ